MTNTALVEPRVDGYRKYSPYLTSLMHLSDSEDIDEEPAKNNDIDIKEPENANDFEDNIEFESFIDEENEPQQKRPKSDWILTIVYSKSVTAPAYLHIAVFGQIQQIYEYAMLSEVPPSYKYIHLLVMTKTAITEIINTTVLAGQVKITLEIVMLINLYCPSACVNSRQRAGRPTSRPLVAQRKPLSEKKSDTKRKKSDDRRMNDDGRRTVRRQKGERKSDGKRTNDDDKRTETRRRGVIRKFASLNK
ncbi:hypothetical protein NQ318_010790 [Aromia moschata]|uniref:Uncharacterized protein n=1 Tax=Aromia moschata TaxID=1265417 RepID=A0AAV8XC70_9CUCU|nr:hypothetical protein NQ318_010790 [Aromia moschata]